MLVGIEISNHRNEVVWLIMKKGADAQAKHNTFCNAAERRPGLAD
jgi:hypothetical protein